MKHQIITKLVHRDTLKLYPSEERGLMWEGILKHTSYCKKEECVNSFEDAGGFYP